MQWRGVTIGNAMQNGWVSQWPPSLLIGWDTISWFLLQGNNAMIKDGILGNAHR